MVNKVILIGRLGKDPEIRWLTSGSAVANFSLATSENWTKDGERKTKTEWHQIVVFGRLAEVCAEYLTKGSLVYLEGKIQTRIWEDSEGSKRRTTEIVVREIDFLERKEKPQKQQLEIEDDVPF